MCLTRARGSRTRSTRIAITQGETRMLTLKRGRSTGRPLRGGGRQRSCVGALGAAVLSACGGGADGSSAASQDTLTVALPGWTPQSFDLPTNCSSPIFELAYEPLIRISATGGVRAGHRRVLGVLGQQHCLHDEDSRWRQVCRRHRPDCRLRPRHVELLQVGSGSQRRLPQAAHVRGGGQRLGPGQLRRAFPRVGVDSSPATRATTA